MNTLAELTGALPDKVVVTDPEAIEKYRFDWTRDSTAGTPLAVVRAESAEHVQTAVRWAAEHRVPVVPRGAGTGLSGGSTAVDGGIVLSLERMRAIRIDTDCQVAVVEPGAFNAEVKAAAAEQGLWYPPDPSSYEICSIGGNVATNAGGLCCVKYGVTTDYVLGLDVVLADGTLVTLGGQRIKDVAGLSLVKLFVGSEGTLGIVTRAILRLVPAQAARSTLVATFPTVDAAARAVVDVRRTMRPSMLELMDRGTINAVEDHRPMGLDRSTGAMLVAQSDAPGTARSDETGLMRTACEAAGASEVFVTDDADEGEMFVQARRLAIPAVEARGALLLEDVGVPVPHASEAARRDRRHRGEPLPGDPGDRARRRRQHPPTDRVRRRRPRRREAGPRGVRRDDAPDHRAGRHHHRRARRRPQPPGGTARPARPGGDGADPADQGRPRPGRDPQPRSDPLASCP